MSFGNNIFVFVIINCFQLVLCITNSNISDSHAQILWQLSDLAFQTQGRQYSQNPFRFSEYPSPQKYSYENLNYQGYYQNYDVAQPNRQEEYLSDEIPQKYTTQNYPNIRPELNEIRSRFPQNYPYRPQNYPYKPYAPQIYPYPNYYPQKYLPSSKVPSKESIMDVLFSIAQNDDLQCVPKLVCELTSGSMSSRQLGLPVNISPETLVGLLTTFNSAQSSPILHFGKAAFLGFTSKGNSRSCALAYPSCPSDSVKLITYLNNHKGGFFRFFQGLMSQPQNYAHLYNKYRPSYYQQNLPYAQRRIVTHVPTGGLNNGLFFNEDHAVEFPKEGYGYQPYYYPYQNYKQEYYQNFHRDSRRLSFPDVAPYRSPKKLVNFEEINENVLDIQKPLPNHVPNPMIFPDRTGTGELKLDYSELFDANGNTDKFSFPN